MILWGCWMSDKRNYAFLGISFFLLVLAGCAYDQEPMPQITQDYSADSPGVLGQDIYSNSKPNTANSLQRVSSGWIPPSYLEKNWTAIIIHHSATDNGNARIFDRWHRQGNHWDSIGYDFVIGNGTNSGDGQVEVTARWHQQKTGAHCGGTPGNWANKDGIGICLVGNFDKYRPTSRQMHSLVRLVRFLKERYRIPASRIYGHGSTPGAHKTNCPGRKFSMSELKSMLD